MKNYNHNEKRIGGKQFKNFLIDLGFGDKLKSKTDLDFEIEIDFYTLTKFFNNYDAIRVNIKNQSSKMLVFSLALPLIDYLVACTVIPISENKSEIKFDRVKKLV